MDKNRLISATGMIFLAIWAVLNKWIFILVLLALTIGGLYEFFYLIQKKGIPIYRYTGILIGVIIPVSIFFKFELTKNWELLFIVLALLFIFLMQFARKENANAIVGISTTLFGILYVSWFFSFLIKIRFLLPDDVGGMKLLAFVLLVTKSGDIGALLVGSRFGKHLLFPRISPKKTVEGSIGSFAFSMLTAFLAYSWIPPSLSLSSGEVMWIGAFLGGIGQLGDLSESLIKRDCNVKDSGKMLAGLGGVLDTIDSLLFAAPAFYFYISSALDAVRYGM